MLKGTKHTKETKRKMSKIKKGKIPKNFQLIKGWNKGKHLSEEHKRKIGEANKGRKLPPFSEERRRKMSEAHKGKFNEKASNWKGDNIVYNSLHEWLRKKFKKPNQCQHCGKLRKLDWANITGIYTRDIKNYLALCKSCHIKFDKNEIRKFENLSRLGSFGRKRIR